MILRIAYGRGLKEGGGLNTEITGIPNNFLIPKKKQNKLPL